MIHEITQFVDYLDEKDKSIFSAEMELKEGFYVFLEREGEELVVKAENTLEVTKKTKRDELSGNDLKLYDEFLERYIKIEPVSNNKAFNRKLFGQTANPYAIGIAMKHYRDKSKHSEAIMQKSLNEYFDNAAKFIHEDATEMVALFKGYLLQNLWDFLKESPVVQNLNATAAAYVFLKNDLTDFANPYNKYLSERLFNKDKFNVQNEFGDIFGISDDLSGFNDKKEFLKHKTAPLELNFRVNGINALKISQFFRLQQKNKILPNPMPLFVDRNELTQKAITYFKEDKTKRGHKEIVEALLKENNGESLQNYYLIFFHNGQKGSRIVDLDFVPVFRYKTDDMPKIRALFKMKSKEKGELFRDFTIENIFHFQTVVLNKILNGQLIQQTKNGLWLKYFDDIKVSNYATDTIVNLFYKYCKAFYDYVYKSKRQAITDTMFHDIMQNSILDDIRHDKEHDKTYRIKEKLNIWFSLYNYFNHNKKFEDMVNRTQELFEEVSKIANNEEERMQTDFQFAFASGQLIRTILNKSKTGERSHSLLEPFLQKTNPEQYKLAIARAFETYKHEFQFYKGNTRYAFDKIMSEVMGFEPDEKNLKKLLHLILAGYFAETVFKREEKNDNVEPENNN